MVFEINKEASRQDLPLQMTPMIDVTFQLLIFFLCSIKFRTLEGKLGAHLPRDVGVNASLSQPLDRVEVQIHVVREGRKVDELDPSLPYVPEVQGRAYRYVDRELRYSIGPRSTSDPAVLKAWLLEQVGVNRREDGKPRPCAIDPRKGVVYEDVVTVLDAAWEARFEEIAFVASAEKG